MNVNEFLWACVGKFIRKSFGLFAPVCDNILTENVVHDHRRGDHYSNYSADAWMLFKSPLNLFFFLLFSVSWLPFLVARFAITYTHTLNRIGQDSARVFSLLWFYERNKLTSPEVIKKEREKKFATINIYTHRLDQKSGMQSERLYNMFAEFVVVLSSSHWLMMI